MLVINPTLFRLMDQGLRNEAVTPENVEKELDDGHLLVATNSGSWWRVRRNGKTKRWKTRPNDFHIPVKAGYRTFGAITQKDFVESNDAVESNDGQ